MELHFVTAGRDKEPHGEECMDPRWCDIFDVFTLVLLTMRTIISVKDAWLYYNLAMRYV